MWPKKFIPISGVCFKLNSVSYCFVEIATREILKAVDLPIQEPVYSEVNINDKRFPVRVITRRLCTQK